MTIQEAINQSGIHQLDAEVLLAHVLGISREKLITQQHSLLSPEQITTWNEVVERRKSHEPVAYITGEKEFYGRSFLVSSDVLIPRPATENVIDAVAKLQKEPNDDIVEADTDIVVGTKVFGDVSKAKTLVDIGTGSGCIAITLKLQFPDFTVIATDISEAALKVARQNADHHKVEVDFRVGDLCEPIADVCEPFIAVSNPPYIPSSEKLMPDVEDFEPHLALFSGEDGSNAVVKLYNRLRENKHCRALIMECRRAQWKY